MTETSAPAEVLIALLRDRDGQEFDGEIHLASEEGLRLIEALEKPLAADALELAADEIGALATPAPVAGTALDAGTVEACAKVAEAEMHKHGIEFETLPYGHPDRHEVQSCRLTAARIVAAIRALSPGKTVGAGVGESKP
jgi:hypothetical protein